VPFALKHLAVFVLQTRHLQNIIPRWNNALVAVVAEDGGGGDESSRGGGKGTLLEQCKANESTFLDATTTTTTRVLGHGEGGGGRGNVDVGKPAKTVLRTRCRFGKRVLEC
jgi:hypothetical protein